jgi:hypothetical protein
MQYAAYFDESGSPDEGKHVIVSGFVAPLDQWVHFESEWRSVLDAHGVSVFHAKDFGHCQGEFKCWKDDRNKRRWFLESLVGIICRRTDKSFSTAIPLKEFRDVDREFLLKESVGHPYPLAARICMARVEEWGMARSIEGQVQFFFEDGAKNKGQLLWIAEKDGKPTPIFTKKQDACQFQAADLLAWEHNRLLRKNQDEWLNDLSPALQRLDGMPNDWGICGKLQLMDLCNDVKPRNRYCRYSYKIIRYGRRRVPVTRVELKGKWRLPTSDGGKELLFMVGRIVAPDENSVSSWGVFENIGGDAVQIQLRRQAKRESLIIEEVQVRGTNTMIADKAREWIAQKVSNPSFGCAPNIVVYSWDCQLVP